MSLLVIYKYIIIYTHTFFSNFLMKVVFFIYYIDNIFIKNANGERKEYTRKDCHPPPKKKEKKKGLSRGRFFFFFSYKK